MTSEQKEKKEQKQALYAKAAMSAAVALLIVIQLWTSFELTPETVALVVLALLPWVSTVIESVELPGGGKVQFREVRATVAAQQEQLQAQQKIINELVLYSMSYLIFQHLAGIHHASYGRASANSVSSFVISKSASSSWSGHA